MDRGYEHLVFQPRTQVLFSCLQSEHFLYLLSSLLGPSFQVLKGGALSNSSIHSLLLSQVSNHD